ncbi:hypothetical protein E1B28_008387 [Marasmius oreades]|uniref:Uncharacterized protein n=1 Tax=Marasmius oreades TaxID=181124 RepID=A0A9P7USC2_9AGAR|nr:uncharacterized protein E1B28_008387 [Marasmius oreades]KAG7092000.1 hypothetical protein E1B28_008387 [Marasmius oreades]
MANPIPPSLENKTRDLRGYLETKRYSVIDPTAIDHQDVAHMLCCWGRGDELETSVGTIKLSPVGTKPSPAGTEPSPTGTSLSSLQAPFPRNGVITVQSEYLELERRIMNQYASDYKNRRNDRRGVLVTGMPGIGKSVFLIYLLAKTLARKQPVFLHIQSNTFVFLGPEVTDVYAVPDSSGVLRSVYVSDMLFLVDMDWTSAENPLFMKKRNMLFTVGTSSPNPRLQRLKTWRKEFRITSLVMNPPDVADVVKIFTHAYPRSGLTAPKTENFIRLLIQTFNVDLRRFEEIFSELRFHSNTAVLSKASQDFVDDVRGALDDLKAEDVASLLRGSSDYPQYSHRLIASYRRRPLLPPTHLHLEPNHTLRHEVRSSLVVNLLCEAWTKQADKMRTIMETLLSSNMKMAAALGWLFEAEGHTHIVTNQCLKIYPMTETWVGTNKTYLSQAEHAQSMEIGPRAMTLYDSTSDPSTTCEQNAYYVPIQVNNPLFDSFLAGKDFGAAFQMTRSGTHSFKTTYLKPLQKRLEAICGKPPSGFHFVFVVQRGKKIQIRIPDTAVTRMFRYYTLPLASQSLGLQNPEAVLKENGMGGMIGEVEPDVDEYVEDGETVDDGDIIMDWI